MIFFSIEDAFYQKTILDCLVQIDQKIVSADKMNSFCDVSIAVDAKKIKIIFDGESLQLTNPCSSRDLYKDIVELVSDWGINIQTIKYYPFKQEIISIIEKDNSIKLNFISNNILNHLLLDKTGLGILKSELYDHIWPQDKTLSMNKLDTHLTNTKNLFKENFNVDLKFQTINGKVRLIY